MPVRRVVTPSGRRVRGYFPSTKMGRMIAWESQIERDAILLLEHLPEVIRYEEQPEKVIFYVNGEQHTYFPDFAVELTNGVVIHLEVKPASKLKKKELKQRFEQIADHYANKETPFLIWTDKEIRVEPRLSNLKLLAYHRKDTDQDGTSLSDWIAQLSILPAFTIGGAEAVLGDITKVYRLLAAGYLNCDIEKPITKTTQITYQTGGQQNVALFI